MSHDKKRTFQKVFLNLGLMTALLLFCVTLLPRLLVLFMPFVVGLVIALIASPIVHFFESKLRIRRKAGTAFVIIAVIALVIVGGYFILSALFRQIIDFASDIPEMWAAMQADFSATGDNLSKASQFLPKELQNTIGNIMSNIQDYIGDAISSFSAPTFEALSNFAKNIPNIIISTIMALLFSYFYVAEKDYLPGLMEKILPESILQRLGMIKRGLARAVGGYFKAQVKIEIWMYVLLAIGFWVLDVNYAFLIAVGVAVLDMLPFFGTGTVLLPWAVIKLLGGDYGMVIGLLIIWGVGQLARQIIQPKIVGDSVGLSAIPTIILLYLGYKCGSVIGMIIAVPIGIIVLNLYEEGVFNTTINSLKILYASISNFRHLTEEDMEELEKYRARERAQAELMQEENGKAKEAQDKPQM